MGCTCRRWSVIIPRARIRRGINTSERARQHCRINGKDCLFNRVTGSSASTDLNWNSIVYRARPCLRRHRRNCRFVDWDKDSATFHASNVVWWLVWICNEYQHADFLPLPLFPTLFRRMTGEVSNRVVKGEETRTSFAESLDVCRR